MVFLTLEQIEHIISSLRTTCIIDKERLTTTPAAQSEKVAQEFKQRCELDESIVHALRDELALEHTHEEHIGAIAELTELCANIDSLFIPVDDGFCTHNNEDIKSALRYATHYLQRVPRYEWLPVTEKAPGHDEDVMVAIFDPAEQAYFTLQARRKMHSGSVFDADDGKQYLDVPLWSPVIQPPRYLEGECPVCHETFQSPVFEDERGEHIVCGCCGSRPCVKDCEVMD